MAGRPTDYKEEYNEKAYKLCLLHATDKELADFFEVSESTLNLWKTKHPDFSESIKKGKIIADANIAESLYQTGNGYERDEVELKVVSLGQGQGSEVQEIPVKRYYPPNPTAAIFWLKNRQSAKWRDKQEIEVTDNTDRAERMRKARERIRNAQTGKGNKPRGTRTN